MVSPDGLLLFKLKDTGESTGKNDEFYDAAAYVGADSQGSPRGEKEILTTLKEDTLDDNYESAISIGNDLEVDGELKANGFSAKGWDPTLATMAIRRAEETLM